MAESKWTRNPPTEAFTYWWYKTPHSGVDLCQIRSRQSFRQGEGLILVACFPDGSEVRDLTKGWWLGPIAPPKDPA